MKSFAGRICRIVKKNKNIHRMIAILLTIVLYTTNIIPMASAFVELFPIEFSSESLQENLVGAGASGLVLTATSMGIQNYIHLAWNAPNDGQSFSYRLFQKGGNSEDFEPRSLNYDRDIKVLNIYPNAGNNLKTWMENDGAGRGQIEVTAVNILDFNVNPGLYLKNPSGDYLYDAIMFGSWDANNSLDISASARIEVEQFLLTGRGVIFGHDTVTTAVNNPNFQYFASYLNMELDLEVPMIGSGVVKVTNDGFLLKYPWTIPYNTNLNIPVAHSTCQIAKGTKWMEFVQPFDATFNGSIITPPTGGTSNFYLTTVNNVAMIQTGHSSGLATDDEKHILANVLFYVSQYTINTDAADRSAMDLAGPEAPTVDVIYTSDITNVGLDIDAQDRGTTYEYYMEATGIVNSSEEYTSETVSEEIITGTKGYVIVKDSSPGTVPAITKDGLGNVNLTVTQGAPYYIDYTQDYEQYLHIIPIDHANNVGDIIHIKIGTLIGGADVTVKHTGIPQPDETILGAIGLGLEVSPKTVANMFVAYVKLNGQPVAGLTYPITSFTVESVREQGDVVEFVYFDETIITPPPPPETSEFANVTVKHTGIPQPDETVLGVIGLGLEVKPKTVANMFVAYVKLNGVPVAGLTYPITSFTVESVREQGDVVEFVYFDETIVTPPPPPETTEFATVTVKHTGIPQPDETVVGVVGLGLEVKPKTVTNMFVAYVKLNGIPVAGLPYPITSFVVESVREQGDIVEFVYFDETIITPPPPPETSEFANVTVKHTGIVQPDETVLGVIGLGLEVKPKTVANMFVAYVKLNGVPVAGLPYLITNYVVESVREQGDVVEFIYFDETIITPPPPPETSEFATVTIKHTGIPQPDETMVGVIGLGFEVKPKTVTNMFVAYVKLNGIPVAGLPYPITNFVVESVREQGDVVEFIYFDETIITPPPPPETSEFADVTVKHTGIPQPDETVLGVIGLGLEVKPKTVTNMFVAYVKLNGVPVAGLPYSITNFVVESVREQGDVVEFVYFDETIITPPPPPETSEFADVTVKHTGIVQPDETVVGVIGLGLEVKPKTVTNMFVAYVKLNGVPVAGLPYSITNFIVESVREQGDVVEFIYFDETIITPPPPPETSEFADVTVKHTGIPQPDETIIGVIGLGLEVKPKTVANMFVAYVKHNGVPVAGLSYPITNFVIESVREQGDVVEFVYFDETIITPPPPPETSEFADVTVKHTGIPQPDETVLGVIGLGLEVKPKTVTNMFVAYVKHNGVPTAGLSYPITNFVISSVQEEGDIVEFVYFDETIITPPPPPETSEFATVTVKHTGIPHPDETMVGVIGLGLEVKPKTVANMFVAYVVLNGEPVAGLAYPITNFVISSVREVGDVVEFVYFDETIITPPPPPETSEFAAVTVKHTGIPQPDEIKVGVIGLGLEVKPKTVANMFVAYVKLNGEPVAGLTYPITNFVISSVRKAGDVVEFVYFDETIITPPPPPETSEFAAVTVKHTGIPQPDETMVGVIGLGFEVKPKTVTNMFVAYVKLNGVPVAGLTYPITNYVISSVRKAGDVVEFVYFDETIITPPPPPETSEFAAVTVKHTGIPQPDETMVGVIGLGLEVKPKTVTNMFVAYVKLNGVPVSGLSYPIINFVIPSVREAGDVVEFVYFDETIITPPPPPDTSEFATVTVKHTGIPQPDETMVGVIGLGLEVKPKTVANMFVAYVKLNGVPVSGLSYLIENYVISSVRKSGDVVEFVYFDGRIITPPPPPDTSEFTDVTVKHIGIEQADETILGVIGLGLEVNAKKVTNMCVKEVIYNGVTIHGLSYPIKNYIIRSVQDKDVITFVYADDLNGDGIPDELQNARITVLYVNTNEPDETVIGTLNLPKTIQAKSVQGMYIKEVRYNGIKAEDLSQPITSHTITSVQDEDEVIFVYVEDDTKSPNILPKTGIIRILIPIIIFMIGCVIVQKQLLKYKGSAQQIK